MGFIPVVASCSIREAILDCTWARDFPAAGRSSLPIASGDLPRKQGRLRHAGGQIFVAILEQMAQNQDQVGETRV
jgi:hypothetical protein